MEIPNQPVQPLQPAPSAQPTAPVQPAHGSEKKFSKKIPILIGLCIAALAILILLARGSLTKAGDDKPTNVTITPTSANSVTVNWSTGNPTIGQVMTSTDMDTFIGTASTESVPDYTPEDGELKTDHAVVLDNLQAGTTYYLQIQIGDSVYDNDGVPYTFTTPATDADVDTQPPVRGAKPTSSVSNPFSTSPTPIQHLVIPNSQAAPTTAVAACTYTNCDEIKAHFGQGCATKDYIQCLKK